MKRFKKSIGLMVALGLLSGGASAFAAAGAMMPTLPAPVAALVAGTNPLLTFGGQTFATIWANPSSAISVANMTSVQKDGATYYYVVAELITGSGSSSSSYNFSAAVCAYGLVDAQNQGKANWNTLKGILNTQIKSIVGSTSRAADFSGGSTSATWYYGENTSSTYYRGLSCAYSYSSNSS